MDKFIYVCYIKTTAEKLWGALTNPEFTQQYWWGRRLVSDWKIGSEIRALYDGNKIDWQGKVLAFQPPSLLSYTFHLEERADLKNDKPSTVVFEIATAGKSVMKLTLTHKNLSAKALDDVSDGWPAILCAIKSLLESGKALEYE